MLNEKIKDAIKLRMDLENYLRAVTQIDDTVLGVELSRSFPISKNDGMIDIWSEWRQLANHFQAMKDSSIDGKGGHRREDLIKRTSGELKALFKETILEVLIETILFYGTVNAVELSESGFNLFSTKKPGYCPSNYKRYRIPKKILKIFNSDSSHPILNQDFVKTVLDEFTYENLCFNSYLTVRDSIIFININL